VAQSGDDMGFVLILVAANYHQTIVCGGGVRREEGEEERGKRRKEEEGGGTSVTYHLNMCLEKRYSHYFYVHGRDTTGTAGLGHRLGRTASQHAGGRRSV